MVLENWIVGLLSPKLPLFLLLGENLLQCVVEPTTERGRDRERGAGCSWLENKALRGRAVVDLQHSTLFQVHASSCIYVDLHLAAFL